MDPPNKRGSGANENARQCPHCNRAPFETLESLKVHFAAARHVPQCHICGEWLNGIGMLLFHYHANHPDAKHLATLSVASRTRAARAYAQKQKHEERPITRDQIDPPCQYTDPDGINPTNIQPKAQDEVYRLLLDKCHSIATLEAQNFTLPSNIDSKKKKESKAFLDVKDFITLPERSVMRKVKGLVIDCEMVRSIEGSQEVAYLSAIDFLSGDVLISCFIEPRREVVYWATPHSGITADSMRIAREFDSVMQWDEARAIICMNCSTNTILVGHALKHDLDVLGLMHLKVVDSSLLTAHAVFPEPEFQHRIPRIWSLKTLAKELVGDDIQRGRKGHSALEDAYATREVVIQCLTNPDKLKVWAADKRKIEDELKAKREAKAEEDRKERKAEEERKKQNAALAAQENKTGSENKGENDSDEDSWKGDN